VLSAAALIAVLAAVLVVLLVAEGRARAGSRVPRASSGPEPGPA
jgi:hypothetical protein